MPSLAMLTEPKKSAGARVSHDALEQNARLLEGVAEMLDRARTARCNERYMADLSHGAQLPEVVAAAHAVARHAIEHDLPRAALLHLGYPVECVAPRLAAAIRVAGVLEHPVAARAPQAVDADDDALTAEALAQGIDESGLG